jgi:hypothetical protein
LPLESVHQDVRQLSFRGLPLRYPASTTTTTAARPHPPQDVLAQAQPTRASPTRARARGHAAAGCGDFTLPLLSSGVPLARARGPPMTSRTSLPLSGIVTATTVPARAASDRGYSLLTRLTAPQSASPSTSLPAQPGGKPRAAPASWEYGASRASMPVKLPR